MRNLHIYLSALSVLHPVLGIRHGSSELRDLEAFPKFEVQFLNHLPVAESEARRTQSEGIRREEEWVRFKPGSPGMQQLGDGSADWAPAEAERLELIRMALKNPASNETQPYLCLMPSASKRAEQNVQAEVEPVHEEIDPLQAWSALSHLEGKCLYAKQGWFTYAYCHDSHLRQFRSAPHTHPHPPGGYVPEEDPTYDAYTLGQARPSPRKQARSSLPQARAAQAQAGTPKADTPVDGGHSVDRADSVAHPSSAITSSLSGANRYLVQKWSDGTRCDKTGRPRETEVQFHCSMTTNDQIYLIKELAICQYVLIIHSPHLCSLPGFRPEKVDVEPAGIQCRQVMKDEEYRAWREREDLGELPSLRPPGLEAESTIGGDIADSEGPSLKELLKKAYESKQAQLGGAGPAKDAVRGSGDQADVAGREQEVMFISIEEDEDGNAAMVLDTEAMLQTILGEAKTEVQAAIQAAGEGGHDLADKEREMIIKAVREFLGRTRASKGKEGDDEFDEARVRDEL